MATATPTHHTGHDRLAINRLGLWLFLGSETFLFFALLSSRFYLQGVERPDHLNQPLGLVISIILLLSSLTAYRSEIAAGHGDQTGFRRNVLFTIGLGLVFLAGVGFEWREAFMHFPPSTGFGTIFFTLTGVHAFHVLSGIILLALVYFLGRSGRFTAGSYWGVEGVVKYWHFVDVAWVLIYPTVYLVS